MSWKVEVVADNSGKWVSNSLRFPSKLQADRYAIDLERKWTAVREWRSIEVKEPVNADVNMLDGEIA